ncbi:roadblock/LC7 domain-containing protein [Streptomyces pathocidini]|uniref:roadblock/LC7 domain-containing protein n=1 Tax=Streptomyces pathocidini TaxID=1650571 RepID=UPI0033F7B99E
MTLEPQVSAELLSLRDQVRYVQGGLVASADGLVVAHDLSGVEPEGLAALTAAAIGVAKRLSEATGQGGFEESVTRGEHGYTAVYAAGSSAVLTVLAGSETNIGRLHLRGRRAAAHIGALVDAAIHQHQEGH